MKIYCWEVPTVLVRSVIPTAQEHFPQVVAFLKAVSFCLNLS